MEKYAMQTTAPDNDEIREHFGIFVRWLHSKNPTGSTSRVQSTRTPSPFSNEVEYFVARKARTESPISVRAFRPLQLASYRCPKASLMEQQLAPALGRLRILLEELCAPPRGPDFDETRCRRAPGHSRRAGTARSKTLRGEY